MKKQPKTPPPKIPKVRIARPAGRPYQLRYICPIENRPIRVSVGSRDEGEASRMKAELEAKLLLGIETRPGKEKQAGPDMVWDEFREQYRVLHLTTVRDGTAIHAESRLDLAERILKPRTLVDVADPNALQRLQARFLAGEQSRRNKPRSAHTVRGYMNSVLSAMNWAYLQGWLPVAPKLRKIKTAKQKAMKGRPITAEEFHRMLDATVMVVRPPRALGFGPPPRRVDARLLGQAWSHSPGLERRQTPDLRDPGGDAEERYRGEYPAPPVVRRRVTRDARRTAYKVGVQPVVPTTQTWPERHATTPGCGIGGEGHRPDREGSRGGGRARRRANRKAHEVRHSPRPAAILRGKTPGRRGAASGNLPRDEALLVGNDPQALRARQRPERRRGTAVGSYVAKEGGCGKARRIICTLEIRVHHGATKEGRST